MGFNIKIQGKGRLIFSSHFFPSKLYDFLQNIDRKQSLFSWGWSHHLTIFHFPWAWRSPDDDRIDVVVNLGENYHVSLPLAGSKQSFSQVDMFLQIRLNYLSVASKWFVIFIFILFFSFFFGWMNAVAESCSWCILGLIWKLNFFWVQIHVLCKVVFVSSDILLTMYH